jgi:cobalt-zinc-cadmium efflux system protein
VLGLLLAWGAATLARRQPSARRTYGLRRSTILVALANAILLLVAVGGITWEAIRRFLHPEPVAGGIVIGVAAVGVLVNGVTAALFLSGRKTDLNVRGAFLHMAADAAVSLGVVLAGFGMVATGWVWLDPAVALAIVAVITIGTWGLLRESLDLAMDAVPTGIDPEEVESYLSSLPGVASVHDLHIWAMSTTESALTVHVVCPSRMEDDALSRVCSEIHRRVGIEHCTIQLELGTGAKPCPQAHEEAV